MVAILICGSVFSQSNLHKIIQPLKNSTDEAADSSFVVFKPGDYTSFSVELVGSGGVTYYAYATNDKTLPITTSGGWIPFNIALFSEGSVSDGSHIYFINGFSPERVMIKSVNSDNTNANKIIITLYK